VDREQVSTEEFGALFRGLSAWGRWGDDDERGALNHITPEHVAAAARLVQEGVTVSLSWPLNTVPAPDNPHPAEHRMTAFGGDGGLNLAKDYVGVDYHNDTHTHVDALCHIGYDGVLYNGRPADTVTSDGAKAESIESLTDGLVGRGVLLDIPRLRDAPWLEPGENVFREDLEAAEREQGVVTKEGDILLVRTGHARRLDELGPWDTSVAKAGIHPTALSFLPERSVAVLGSDTNSDTAPSSTDGIDFPVHVIALAAMGVHLLDYLRLEELLAACEDAGRWEFLFVGAPLRITGGTGSPLNPIAIL
jgi:kynurenine formamidase